MFEDKKYELFHGDCLEIMDDLIEKGVMVDMVLCDPPYGTTSCKWDSIIPLDKMWKRLNKLIKPNGAIALFCSMPFTANLTYSNIKGYKHHWMWVKERGIGFQVAKYRPMMQHEDIIVFTRKGEKVNYYPQMIKLDKPKKYKTTSKTGHNFGCDKKEISYYMVDSKYPTNILNFNRVSKTVHPTQKPTDLLEYLIKTYTKEEELVLDFTMGSGSTGIACLNTNRYFIGIELEEKYFEIAKNRMENN